MYVNRTLEKAILKANEAFPIVLVTGPRQVGKTTILQNCDKNRSYISLDKLSIREFAKEDPELFLQRYQPPVLIDEIQYATELFPYIKSIVDEKKQNGLFWITGSQQFHLMRNVSESLAGRVAVLNLQGLSQREKFGFPESDSFVKTTDFTKLREESKYTNLQELYEIIWKGSYPAIFAKQDIELCEMFYSSYINTYIERDIRELSSINNELIFIKFMRSLAARTGQLLNYTDISNDIGVSAPTIRAWTSILQTSGLIYLLEPYYENITNRMVKTPKIYFMDTGLAAYLTGWQTPKTLEFGAMNGAFFETYVVSEIIKSFWHNGKRAPIYFYRDRDKREIDLLIDINGKLHPAEIKRKSAPDRNDIKHFKIIEDFEDGYLICMCDTDRKISPNVTSIPIGYI